MRVPSGIGPIELRIVKAGRRRSAVFALSGTSQLRDAVDRRERHARGRRSSQEAPAVQRACAKVKLEASAHGVEDLRHADCRGEPVDIDPDAVARVIDEQPLARRVASRRIVGDSFASKPR